MTFAMTAREPRLVIAHHLVVADHLHGAWWPRSTDVNLEIAPLLRTLTERYRAVLGVALNRDEWPGAPLTLQPSTIGRTKIAWYGLTERNLAVARFDQHRRIRLLVVPPDTAEEIALTATLMAATPGNDLTTADVLARAHAAHPELAG